MFRNDAERDGGEVGFFVLFCLVCFFFFFVSLFILRPTLDALV